MNSSVLRAGADGVQQLKIAVLGSPDVGKTTLLSVFVRNEFEPSVLLKDTYTLWKKRVVLSGEKSDDYALSISTDSPDLAAAIPVEICNADGFFFMYSICSKESFRYISDLRNVIFKQRSSPLFPMIVVGNFLDQKDKREVEEQVVKKWSVKFEAPCFEITTRNMKSVSNCFLSLTREIVNSSVQEDSESDSDDEDEPKRPAGPRAESDSVDELQELNLSEGIKFAMEVGKMRVKAGNLEKLVERLTYQSFPDITFQYTFLLSFRNFTTPAVLLTLLMRRYCLSLPANTHPSDVEHFNEKRKKPIQLRVYNAMKKWIELYFFDFERSSMLLTTLLSFAGTVMSQDNQPLGMKTVTQIRAKLAEKDKPPEIRFASSTPKPILPKNIDRIRVIESILDLDPLEVARQMTAREGEMYGAIEATELVNQPWSKKGKEEKAPHVLEMINWFNTASLYVTTQILTTEKMSQRIALLKHFIRIGKECLGLNNFNGLMEILCGLGNTTVFRLKKTWKSLPEKYDQVFSELKEVMSPQQNFSKFREALHNIQPPCIPHLGLYLTDLTFMEDGSHDYLEGGLINFEKRNMVAEVVREIVDYQQAKYNLQKVEKFQAFFDTWEKHIVSNEDDLWELSWKVEPKASARRGTASGSSAGKAGSSKTGTSKRQEDEEPPAEVVAVPKIKVKREKLKLRWATQREITTAEMMQQFEEIASRKEVGQFLDFWSNWCRMFKDNLPPTTFGTEILCFKHTDPLTNEAELLSFRDVVLASRLVECLARRIAVNPSPDMDMQLKDILANVMIGTHDFFHELIEKLQEVSKTEELPAELVDRLAKAVAIFQQMPIKRKVLREKERIEKETRVEELTALELTSQEGYHSVTLGLMKIESVRRLMTLYQSRRKLVAESDVLSSWERLRMMPTDEVIALMQPPESCPEAVEVVFRLLGEHFIKHCQQDELDYASMMSSVTGDYLESVLSSLDVILAQMVLLEKRFRRLIPMLEELEAQEPDREEEDEGSQDGVDGLAKASKEAMSPFSARREEEDKEFEIHGTGAEVECDLTEFVEAPLIEEIESLLLKDIRALAKVFDEVEAVEGEVEMLLLLWEDPEHDDQKVRLRNGLQLLSARRELIKESFPLVREKLDDPELREPSFEDADVDSAEAPMIRGRAESRAVQLDGPIRSPKFSGLKSPRRDSVSLRVAKKETTVHGRLRVHGTGEKEKKPRHEKQELGTPEERELYKRFHTYVVNNDISSLSKAFEKYKFDPNFKPSTKIVSLMHLAARNGNRDALACLIDHGGDTSGVDHKNLTPLHYATDNGNAACMELLLERSADIESRDSYQQTPLHFATCRRDKACLQILLDAGASVNARTKKGSTPLHLAAKSGRTDLAAMLVKHGADVNGTTAKLITPLHQAAQTGQLKYCLFLLDCGANIDCRDVDGQTPLYKATAQRNEDLVRLLIEKGADVTVTDNLGQSPLHYSISAGDVDVAALFIERGISVEVTPKNGNTSMHLAARNGQLKSIHLLLKHGADVNSQNAKLLTPLHYATKNGYVDCIRWLLNKGADVNLADSRGWTTLHFAVVAGQTDVIQLLLSRGANVNAGADSIELTSGTPLHLAAVKGQVGVAQLLVDNGASLNAITPLGETPLHNACFCGSLDVAQFLIASGALTSAQTKKGATPLMLAARVGELAVSRLLLEKESKEIASMKTNSGVTALHLAAASGQADVLKLMIRSTPGEQILDMRDDRGASPLHYAARFGKTRGCAALLEKGANINAKDNAGVTPLQLATAEYHKDTAGLLLRRATEVNRIYSKVKPHDFIESQYENLMRDEKSSNAGMNVQSRMLKRSKSKGPPVRAIAH